MADFSQEKPNPTAAYPVHASEWKGDIGVFEDILTVSTFRRRYLKGIPKKYMDELTDEDLKDFLKVAINEAELQLNIPIETRVFIDRLPFDRNQYRSFVHLLTKTRPIRSVLNISIVSSDGKKVYTLPSEWIDTGNFHRGQINVVPYLAAYTSDILSGWQASVGSMFLTAIAAVKWLPGYWNVEYTAGLQCSDGKIPVIVNKLIGTLAAIDLLGNLGTLNQFNSTSIGQDGISQSTSGPGPALYAQRLQELEGQKEALIAKLKGKFGNKYRMVSF